MPKDPRKKKAPRKPKKLQVADQMGKRMIPMVQSMMQGLSGQPMGGMQVK